MIIDDCTKKVQLLPMNSFTILCLKLARLCFNQTYEIYYLLLDLKLRYKRKFHVFKECKINVKPVHQKIGGIMICCQCFEHLNS